MGRSFDTGSFAVAGHGTSGHVLTSQGVGVAPAWAAPAAPDVPGLVFLQAHTFSGALTYDIENFSATYDDYLIIVDQFTPASAGGASVRFKVGGSYLATSTYRSHASKLTSASAAYAAWSTATLPYISLSAAVSCSSAATAKNNFVIQVLNVNDATRHPNILWQGSFFDDTNLHLTNGVADIPTAGALQGLRFMVGDGTAINVGGTVRVYGYRKS